MADLLGRLLDKSLVAVSGERYRLAESSMRLAEAYALNGLARVARRTGRLDTADAHLTTVLDRSRRSTGRATRTPPSRRGGGVRVRHQPEDWSLRSSVP
ncbi:hypothetical protein AB0L25_14055 [Spirillospora sp. NPDC052242]